MARTQARCVQPLTDSQAENAGPIPVIRSKKHLVRGYFRRVVIRCRALPVPRPLVKSGRYRRSSLRWSLELPGREAVAVGMEPRSQAKKLMFRQADVSTAGLAVSQRLWVDSRAHMCLIERVDLTAATRDMRAPKRIGHLGTADLAG